MEITLFLLILHKKVSKTPCFSIRLVKYPSNPPYGWNPLLTPRLTEKQLAGKAIQHGSGAQRAIFNREAFLEFSEFC